MIVGLCLSFMSLGDGKHPVPENVVRIARAQVEKQFRAEHPGTRLLFDDAECPDRGTYEFTNESLILSSERSIWPERREYALSDLIEGRKIEFPVAAAGTNASASSFTERMKEERPNPVARFAGGATIGALGGALAGTSLSPNTASRGTNGIVFGLVGALSGGLLSLLWAEL